MRSANLFGPLKGHCPYKALIGLIQASGLAGGFDSQENTGAAAVEKKTLLGPNLTKGQVWTNTGVVVVNAAVFASLYRVRFSLGEQGSASPHLRTWAGLSGAVIGFDQLLFPRVPLRYALPGDRGSGSERRRWSIRLPSRFMEESSNAAVHTCYAAMYSAPGRRFPYLGSTVQSVPRIAVNPTHLCRVGRLSIFSFDRRSVKQTCRRHVCSVAPNSYAVRGEPRRQTGGSFPRRNAAQSPVPARRRAISSPYPLAEISRTVSRVPSTENLTSIPAKPKPYTRSGSF